MRFRYPPARRSDVADDHHGRLVPDPYRWLEDPASEETAAFVAAQNAISQPYLAGLEERPALHRRMTELWDVPRAQPPILRNGVAVWSYNDGLLDQPLFLIRRPGDTEPEVLLDPNTFSDDGAAAVIVTSLSPDGRLFAYTVAEAGSDRQRLHLRSTETGEDLDDELRHLRFTTVAWFGDGFFYTRFPEVPPDSTEPVDDPTVHYHRIGDHQDADRIVFHNDDDPEPSYFPLVTHDDAYLVLLEHVGTSRHNGLLYLDLRTDRGADLAADLGPDTGPVPADRWTRLVEPEVALHGFALHHDGGFLLHTDDGAPHGAVIHVPLDDPSSRRTVVAEGPDVIEGVAAVAGELFVVRLVEASHTIERYRPDGRSLGGVPLPGLGTIDAVSGRFVDPDVFLGFQSFADPPTVLHHRDGTTGSFADAPPAPTTDPGEIVVERRRATSTDGQEVGMFVVRRADTALPGPVELYGYGGFSINITPTYSPARLAFLEAGGIVAVANLRGGTEHGETWHEQGMLAEKQQVFDDLAACARQLVADGVTTSSRLGIRGGSNGGLLTAVSMIQHPELFGAVVSQVPVTDMLRYQHFTAGRYWTVEYGDASDPEAFAWLIEYSPLHTVGDPSTYPPLLITTAESDDRVVPMHALKWAAELQHRAGGASEQPLLLRMETRAGHGLGKPTSKTIDEAADVYAFLLHHLRPADGARHRSEPSADGASSG